MKLIVGLGNPGRSYARHRHNIGFCIVDAVADRAGLSLGRKAFGALVGEGMLAGEKVMLMKPQEFMNCSGKAVAAATRYYGLSSEAVTVIHDDLDLPLGRLKFGRGLSDGGHNGIKSVIAELGTDEVCQVRVGIGRPPPECDPADYVLSAFTTEEWTAVENVVNDAVVAIEALVEKGLVFVQNRYHTGRR